MTEIVFQHWSGLLGVEILTHDGGTEYLRVKLYVALDPLPSSMNVVVHTMYPEKRAWRFALLAKFAGQLLDRAMGWNDSGIRRVPGEKRRDGSRDGEGVLDRGLAMLKVRDGKGEPIEGN